jgi:hemoglobin-like flavoprotein
MCGRRARLIGRYDVKAEHYPLVANALLPAIRDVLGDAATDEVLGAWGEAYWALADILIGKEEVLYAETDGNGQPEAINPA